MTTTPSTPDHTDTELAQAVAATIRDWDLRSLQTFRSTQLRATFHQCAGELERLLRAHGHHTYPHLTNPTALVAHDADLTVDRVDGIR